jgi:aspartate/methionine/tyrosine aminotransferase
MRFPLADWIDDHGSCRYHFGSSGMVGSVRPPGPRPADLRDAIPRTLEKLLGVVHRVDPARVFLHPGATAANSSVAFFLGRRPGSSAPRCRVLYPEYPSLYQAAELAGFRLTERAEEAELAVVSQPRNPEGDLWEWSRFVGWAEGARHVLVDETFREFAGRPSVSTRNRPRCWVTGSFTKYYGGDDLRVGYVIVPEEELSSYARFHGVVHDELPSRSIAGAIACLRHGARLRQQVADLLHANRAALRRYLPDLAEPAAPLCFDRVPHTSGTVVAELGLRRSILVSPGAMFGDPSGVRICLTRRTFPRDIAEYARFRRELETKPVTPRREASTRRTGRPRRAGRDPAIDGRGSPAEPRPPAGRSRRSAP